MKLELNISDETALKLILAAKEAGITFDELVNMSLTKHVSFLENIKHDEMVILKDKIKSVGNESFNIKALFGKDWSYIKSPKSFGKRAQKYLLSNGYIMSRNNRQIIFYTKSE